MEYKGTKSNEWAYALEKYLSEYIFKDKNKQKMFLMYVVILEESIQGGNFLEEVISKMIKSFSCTEYSEYAKPYAKRVIRLLYGLGL